MSGPQALVGLGRGRGLEARIGLPDDRVADVGATGAGGFTAASVGAKLEVGAAGPWSFAAIAEVSVPLEDGDAVSPLAVLVAGRDLEGASLGGQVEVTWDRAADRVEVGATAVLGAALSGRVGAFVEAAAATTPGGPAVLAQTGGHPPALRRRPARRVRRRGADGRGAGRVRGGRVWRPVLELVMDLNDPYGTGTKPPSPLPTYAVTPGPDREIQRADRRRALDRWIPACAGMTVV